MNYLLKYLSTAPVILTAWLGLTSVFVIFINYVAPSSLIFPSIF